MAAPQQVKRKSPDETDSPCKQPKLHNDAFKYLPRPQSSTPSSQPTITSTAPRTMDLTTMTPDERERDYKTLFSKQNEPLHKLEFPSQAAEYPHLAHEINAAYLRHTIFTVEVWMNYDTVASRFFFDARAQDCGRLRLPPKIINRLLVKHEYGRVRFELRTPFSRLARVMVTVEPTELDVGVCLRMVRGTPYKRDPLLKKGLTLAMNNISKGFEPAGRHGLNFEDLVMIAKQFCIQPVPDEFTNGGWLRNMDAWMNIERKGEPNTGLVENIELYGSRVEDTGVDMFNGE